MSMHIEQYRDVLCGLNQTIWSSAETRFEERQSVAAQLTVLESAGYQIEQGVAGIDTAYIATLGSGKPVIALLAEYDALDGLSQQADVCHPSPRPETTKGHGCGHNLLGTGVIGAALVLKDYYQEHHLSGTIKIFGCPGEEGGSGKVFMARDGLFDDVDIALTWHPSTMNAVMTGSMLANVQAYFRFHGTSAHAGAAPHLGRSALDAVELMNVGVNYMREHMEMTDRVHYAVTDTGGHSPNVVQSHAEVLYLIRSKTAPGARALYNRVCKIAQGAALMTETTVDVEFDKACSQVVPNHTIAKLFHDCMSQLGVPVHSEAERDYVKQFSATMPAEIVANDPGQLPPDYLAETRKALVQDHPDGEFILPFSAQESLVCASSDMGDVSCLVPLVQLQTACFAMGTQPHSWQWVAQGTSAFALHGTLYASQILADTALQLFTHPEIIAQAKDELKNRMSGQPYVCPIPDDVHPRTN
ncbi:amidohydrolase [Pseudoflavonifractor phocaeensis]|uniref:amidohydrolase n=1 Tax=Pseudoflavonifractor phocaeensis TaxID=1870988 RepID=UPI001F1783BD|nr:amidohydrolase [Pseudoflavonifractor phocaeensis]MCF2661538.1 amidohydrolase [Pseudoflavonifractor phocaeensis]